MQKSTCNTIKNGRFGFCKGLPPFDSFAKTLSQSEPCFEPTSPVGPGGWGFASSLSGIWHEQTAVTHTTHAVRPVVYTMQATSTPHSPPRPPHPPLTLPPPHPTFHFAARFVTVAQNATCAVDISSFFNQDNHPVPAENCTLGHWIAARLHASRNVVLRVKGLKCRVTPISSAPDQLI